MMKFRCLFALLALSPAAIESDARPPRRNAQPTYQYQNYSTPSYQYPTYQQPAVVTAGEYSPSYSQPVVTAGGYATNYAPAVAAGFEQNPNAWAGGADALDEVNAKRASRGLRPFVRDAGLTQAAQACAAFRAERGLFGHTSNDFAFVPPGTSASSAGCAAYPASYGWMSCCVYENYTFGGAAWVTGRDGRRYMHLFVR